MNKMIELQNFLQVVFWSLFGFQGYFGHFLGFGGILVIFGLREYFGYFLGFGGILVIFRFQEYFGHFLDF